MVPQDTNVVDSGEIDGDKDAVSRRRTFRWWLGIFQCRETPAHAQSDFARHGRCTPGRECIAYAGPVSRVRRESSNRAMPAWAACPVCSADRVGAKPAANATEGGSGNDTGKAGETVEEQRVRPAAP